MLPCHYMYITPKQTSHSCFTISWESWDDEYCEVAVDMACKLTTTLAYSSELICSGKLAPVEQAHYCGPQERDP